MPGSPFNMAAGHGGKPLHGGRSESSKAAGGLAGTKDALKAGQLADFEGKLHVDLIKAKNLVKADLMGKSDPYAVLKFGKQKEKTNTIKNTLEPQWDFSTDFKVPDGNSDTLLVEVFDSDKLGKDKSLGKVEINLLDLQDTEGKWFALQGVKSGICQNFKLKTSVHQYRFHLTYCRKHLPLIFIQIFKDRPRSLY